MNPLGISMNRLSQDLNVPPNRIHGIVHGTRAITADTALRLGAYFGVAPETWLNLQSDYDLRVALRTAGDTIARTVRRRNAACLTASSSTPRPAVPGSPARAR